MNEQKDKRTAGGFFRRCLGLTLAAGLALGGAVTARADAISTYSVSMSQSYLSILKGGYVTNSFRIAANNADVLTGDDGSLLVGFYNAQNEYVAVTLGSQQIVNFYGAIGTLTLDDSLDRPVVIGASAQVADLRVDAPVKVSVWGKVTGGAVEAAADIVAAKGSRIEDLYFNHTSARLYSQEGAIIDGTTIRSSEDAGAGSRYESNSGSSSSGGSGGTSQTVSGITLHTDTIYADEGDTLGELLGDLEASVEATNRSGKRLYGEVEWVDSDSTEVEENGRYRYRFIPDNDDYKTVTGTARIVVEDDGRKEDLTLEFDKLTTSRDDRRLSAYLNKLQSEVKAYNDDGRRVHGEVKWVGTSNKRVTETDTFKFIFVPYSSKYRSVRDEITIEVLE